MFFEITLIMTLIVAHGIFAGSEIAIVSMRRTRIQALADAGGRRARAVLHLRERPEQLLATVQIAITLLGATAAAYAGASIAPRLAEILELAGVPGLAVQVAFALVVGGVSFLTLVVGELVPKSRALQAAESYSLWVGQALLGLSYVMRPIITFLTGCSNFLLRWFDDETTFMESRLSPEELRAVVREAAESGSLDQRTGEIASRAFDFGQLAVSAVMIPRERIAALDRNAPLDDLKRVLYQTGHERYPVYDNSLDEIVGYLVARDALAVLAEGRELVLGDLLRPAVFLPATAQASRGLRELQRRRTYVGVVVDERGSVVGLVTVDDFVAELVGKIFKERDVPQDPIVREGDDTSLVKADTPVHEVNRTLGLRLPESESWSTLAGLVTARIGRIPDPGDRIELGDVVLEVVEASSRRIVSVRLQKVVPAD